MSRFRRSAAWFAAIVTAASMVPTSLAKGQEGISLSELFPWARFDAAVPTQEAATGVAPGGRPLRHDELLRYFEAVAASSGRARLETYARSHEGRRLVVLAVGDEDVVAGLDEFRAAHARRMDPRGRRPDADAAIIEGARAVAWMAYGIHGDELSSSDAAASLAYWLVAGEDERAAALRRQVVVLIDPCENPDGRERFLAQTTAFAHARPNPDTDDLSHTTVWPWGRGNHYLFDLNRDWFTMVQPESRRSEVIASWNPQLMVDSHEMGAHDTYLFPPPRHPFNPHLPAGTVDWLATFSSDQARALDGRGYAYYTREWNEEFFPGYGSSWASYLGAVGILYEMSSTEGTLVRQRAGTLRTYGQAVEHQVTSSVANLETLARNRREILRSFLRDRRDAVRRGAEGPVRAWLLPPDRHPGRVDSLADLLRRQGVEVLRAASPVRVEALHDARTGVALGRELPAGTWMVPLDQPAAPLIRVLLDPHIPMESAFLREEREHLERGKGTRVYDATAWSLPLAFGVEAYWTEAKPKGDWRPASPSDAKGSLERGAGVVYGYLFDGTEDGSVFALADLLQRGIAVRVAEKPFRIGGRSYDRGAVLVKREGNPENLAEQLEEVASRWPVAVRATPTARAEDGPDLGGSRFDPLVAPRVGVWTGMPVSPPAYGAVWHLLDDVADLRFSGLDLARLESTDLSRYNVLVFPPVIGGPERYRHAFGDPGLDRLRAWVKAGGTAIGIGNGAEFLADDDVELTETRPRRQVLDEFPPAILGLEPEGAEAAGLFRATGVRPSDEEDDEDGKRGRTARRESPYDVAPLIGAGARPFAEGFDAGSPAPRRLAALEDWLETLIPPGEDEPEDEHLEMADERLRRFSPRGALLRVDLDPELWLAWGVGQEAAAWIRTDAALVAEPPVEVAGRLADVERLHLGGLLWPEAAGRIARTAYVTREAVDRGQVILFLDHPVFRGWMLDTRRLFLNAVLYGPGLGTKWSHPW